MKDLVNYQTFSTWQEASDFIDLLNAHQIPFEIDDSAMRFDISAKEINPLEGGVIIKVRATDVEKVKSLDLPNETTELVSDHYLYSFSDNEIMEIIVNPEELTNEEVELAKKIAKQRNLQLTTEIVKSFRKEKITAQANEQEKQEKIISGSASWFLWIAILSIVNITLVAFGQNTSFLLGLGVNYALLGIFGEVDEALGNNLMLYGYITAYLFSALYILIWNKSKKKKQKAYLAGLIIYGIDTLLFVLSKEWFSVALHLFVLWMLYMGYATLLRYRKIEREQVEN